MIFDEVCFHGAECAYANVQGEEVVVDRGEHLGGEVKSGGGGGDRSFFTCEGSLVAVAVGAVAFPVHVVGQGELSVRFFIDLTIPADDPVAIFQNGFDGARGLSNLDGAAGLHFFARADEAFPFCGREFVGADEFNFVVVGEKSGWGDFGIVEDEEVIGGEIRGEISKHPVLNFPAVAVDHHHARGRAVIERAAGDEFVGQSVVEINGAEHAGSVKFLVFSFKMERCLCMLFLCRKIRIET